MRRLGDGSRRAVKSPLRQWYARAVLSRATNGLRLLDHATGKTRFRLFGRGVGHSSLDPNEVKSRCAGRTVISEFILDKEPGVCRDLDITGPRFIEEFPAKLDAFRRHPEITLLE